MVMNYKKWMGRSDSIPLTQVRDKAWAFMNTILKFTVPQHEANFLTS